MSPPEFVKAIEHIKIASYAFNVPNLAFWTFLLLRMLISKDRNKFMGLIVICILIILS
jgi:hypothetical protein